VVGDPVDDILRVAAEMLGQRGLEATTMSRLATAVGLRQSSLYYYFPNRDEVVAALVAKANVVSLDVVRAAAAMDAPATVRLRQFVHGDVEALCALPFDINEVHRIAAREPARFAAYWRERDLLARRLRTIIRGGVEAGELRPVDPALTALTIMSNDEGVQNWYRLGTRRKPAAIARELAELTVRGLAAG
jgi:TetR/AcrR family transcriptional regulator